MSPASGRAASRIVTGAEYVAQITARESDRRARAAFRDLVLRVAHPGDTLFDFGAGTGMDARFYAESELHGASMCVAAPAAPGCA